MSGFKDAARGIALNGAALLLANHQLWYDAKMLAEAVAGDSTLTKEEKHADVFNKLRIVFKDVANSLLDIIIKVAVLWLETQGISNIHAGGKS
jgi:hypothetical protein